MPGGALAGGDAGGPGGVCASEAAAGSCGALRWESACGRHAARHIAQRDGFPDGEQQEGAGAGGVDGGAQKVEGERGEMAEALADWGLREEVLVWLQVRF